MWAASAPLPFQARTGPALEYTGDWSSWAGQMMAIALYFSPSLVNLKRSGWHAGQEGWFPSAQQDVLWRGGWGRLLLLMATPIHPFPWAPCSGQGQIGESTARPPGEQALPRPLSASKTCWTWENPVCPSFTIAISFLWAISQWESSQSSTSPIPCQHEEFISLEISAHILCLCYAENT